MANSNIDENQFEQQNIEIKILKVGIKRFKFLYQRNRLPQKESQKKRIQNKKISKNRLNLIEYNMPCYYDESIQIQKEIEKINLNYLEKNSYSGIEEINTKFINFTLEEQNQQVCKMFGIMNQYNTFDYFNQIQEEY